MQFKEIRTGKQKTIFCNWMIYIQLIWKANARVASVHGETVSPECSAH